MSKNEHLVRYEERKEKIISLLDDAGNYLRENDKPEDAESMFKLKADVEKNLFSVVLIGEFSAGKSTFLNALMRKRILPSFSNETTATVNFLRHTSQAPNGEKGIVYYRNGDTKILSDLSVETIQNFVSTKGDNGDKTIAQTVERVDLFLESKFLEDGVMLVDSPGFNGVAAHLEEITRRQILESHACIFLFKATQPGTRSEFEILRDLRQECTSIFIVLNQIDAIKTYEGETPESIVQNLKDSYRREFPDAKLPEIYPISAYTALAARDKSVPIDRDEGKVKDAEYYETLEEKSRLGDFEERLFRYLTEGERTRNQLSEPVKKVGTALKNEREDLEAQIKALEETRSTSELEAQKSALEEGIANLKKERQTTTAPLRDKFNKTLRDFKDKINFKCDGIAKKIQTQAELLDDTEELQNFASTLPANLKRQFLNLSRHLEDDLREDLKIVVDESVEYFDGLQETLANVSGGELKLYSQDLNLTATEVGKDMEAMEKAFAAKRQEMEKLEGEIAAAEIKGNKARKLESQKEDMQRQLKEIATRRNSVLETFTIPDIEYRTKTVTKKRPRGGLFGAVASIFIGDKEVQEYEDIINSAAHDEAIRMRDHLLSNIDEERAEIIKQMKDYANKNDGTSEDFEAEIQRKTRIREKMEENYNAEVARYTAKLDKDAEKARKNIRREINDFIENFITENVRNIEKYLGDIESQMFDTVKAIIEARLNSEIERQQKKMDMLIEDSKASDAQREEKLQKANASRDLICDLLSKVADLQGELEELTDTIEEE